MRACLVPLSVIAQHHNILSPTYYLGRRQPDRVKHITRLEAKIKRLKDENTAEDRRLLKLKAEGVKFTEDAHADC